MPVLCCWRDPLSALESRPMKRFRTLILILFGLLVTFTSSYPVRAQSGPAPVLAYYYAWWAPEAVGPGKSPDWPVNPYHSWDTGVIQQHVSQAASAGINGLVVAWYGPQEENNQTETNFRVILDQAQANGITALLSIDLGSAAWFKSTQEIIDALNYALSVHAQHPAYFRYNGRPVFFFWYQGRYSLADWAAIRQQVDPNHNSIWIAEGAALDALPTFDGLHMYTISWSQNVAATEAQWSSSTRAKDGLWVGTAMPGWDNTYTQQSERYIRERQDGAFYRETFAAAAASAPSMILITSWNEWWEGTHIEPSANYSDFYLNLTRDLIGEYKASGAVTGGGISAPPVTAAPPAGGSTLQPAPSQAATRGGTRATAEATLATVMPTSTLPPTITPTVQPTATASPTATQLVVATQVAQMNDRAEQNAASQDSSGGALQRLIKSPTDRWIVGGSLLAALLGAILIGAAAIAYKRGRSSPL